jgi:hypothetical protein
MDGTAMIWQLDGAGDATELAPIHVTWKLVSQGFALHFFCSIQKNEVIYIE